MVKHKLDSDRIQKWKHGKPVFPPQDIFAKCTQKKSEKKYNFIWGIIFILCKYYGMLKKYKLQNSINVFTWEKKHYFINNLVI